MALWERRAHAIVHYDHADADGVVYADSPAGWATMGTGLVGAYDAGRAVPGASHASCDDADSHAANLARPIVVRSPRGPPSHPPGQRGYGRSADGRI